MNNELELIEQSKNGDEQAFNVLLLEYLPRLQSLLFKHYHLQQADMDDITQVASAKAWSKLGSFRGESSFLTWFYTIIRNEALNYVKKRQLINSREVSPSQIEGTFNNLGNDPSTECHFEDFLTFNSQTETLAETAASLLEKQEELSIYRQMLENVLAQMTPIHQEIIKLVMEDELSYKEISEKLKVPIGTVMSRLCYARRHAQKLIKQYATQNEIELPV